MDAVFRYSRLIQALPRAGPCIGTNLFHMALADALAMPKVPAFETFTFAQLAELNKRNRRFRPEFIYVMLTFDKILSNVMTFSYELTGHHSCVRTDSSRRPKNRKR